MSNAARILPLNATHPAPAPRQVGQPWSVDELSAFTTLSGPTIRRLIHAGRLERIGDLRRTIITDRSVQTFLTGDAPQFVTPGAAG